MEKYSASFGSLKALSEDESQTKSELSEKNFFVKKRIGQGKPRQVRGATENRADKGSAPKI